MDVTADAVQAYVPARWPASQTILGAAWRTSQNALVFRFLRWGGCGGGGSGSWRSQLWARPALRWGRSTRDSTSRDRTARLRGLGPAPGNADPAASRRTRPFAF